MYLPYYGLRKTWLNKSLQIPLSEDPWRSNILRVTKHFWNLSDTTLTIFIIHCKFSSVGKNLS